MAGTSASGSSLAERRPVLPGLKPAAQTLRRPPRPRGRQPGARRPALLERALHATRSRLRLLPAGPWPGPTIRRPGAGSDWPVPAPCSTPPASSRIQGVRLRAVSSAEPCAPVPGHCPGGGRPAPPGGIAVRVELVSGRQWRSAPSSARFRDDPDRRRPRSGPGEPEHPLRLARDHPDQGLRRPELDAALAEERGPWTSRGEPAPNSGSSRSWPANLPIAPLAKAFKRHLCRRRVTGLPRMEAQGLVPESEFSLVRVRPAGRRREEPVKRRRRWRDWPWPPIASLLGTLAIVPSPSSPCTTRPPAGRS